jgi:hypothetical protein
MHIRQWCCWNSFCVMAIPSIIQLGYLTTSTPIKGGGVRIGPAGPFAQYAAITILFAVSRTLRERS